MLATMTKLTFPVLLAAAAIAFAGCGSDDDTSTAASDGTTASTTTSSSAAPYGTYTRAMTKADIDRTKELRDEHGPNQEAPLTGPYRLVIAKGSGQDVIRAIDPKKFAIAQDVNVNGDALNLTSYVDPAQGAYCGPEIAAAAAYTFTTSGSTLVLKPAKPDPCADRDATLTGTWRKR
jgi:hypothetical protein